LQARDSASPYDDGISPGKNMYGSHPFYLFKMLDGTYGG